MHQRQGGTRGRNNEPVHLAAPEYWLFLSVCPTHLNPCNQAAIRGEDGGFRFADLGFREVIDGYFPLAADPRATLTSVLFAFCGQVRQY